MRKFLGAFALAMAAAISAAPAVAQEASTGAAVPPTCPCTETRTKEVTEPAEFEVVTTKTPSRWYVGGEFGAMIVEDSDVDIGAVDNAIRLNFDYGYDGGLFVGYDLGAFRIEAEAAYKKADLDSFNTSIRLPGEGIAFPTSREFAGGSASALSFMLNGMLDFGDDEEVGDISGFVGGGIGIARVKANNMRVFANTAPFLDDSDSKLAWQVFAGVRQRVTEHLDVTVKYRFFNVDDVRMTAFNGNESEHRFRSHSLLGGITFRFGGSSESVKVCKPNGLQIAVEAECPPITRTVEYQECVECKRPTSTPLPAMVFFDWDQDTITPAGRQILDQAIETYKATGQAQVMIAGHADTSGSVKYNNGLSQRRADNVRAYLAAGGIPDGVMTTEAFGEGRPLVETADGVREPQNRRVEITFGPGSGW